MKKLVLGFGLGIMAVFGFAALSNVDIQAEELDPETVIEEVDEDLDIIKDEIDALLAENDFTLGYAKKIVLLAQNDDTLTVEGLLELTEEEVTALFEAAVEDGSIDMSAYRGAFARAKAFINGLKSGLGKGRMNDHARGGYDGECPVEDTETVDPDIAA